MLPQRSGPAAGLLGPSGVEVFGTPAKHPQDEPADRQQEEERDGMEGGMERGMEGGRAGLHSNIFMCTLLDSGFYEHFITYLLHHCCNFGMRKTEVEKRINRAGCLRWAFYQMSSDINVEVELRKDTGCGKSANVQGKHCNITCL